MTEMTPDTMQTTDINQAIREAVVEKLTDNLKTLYPLALRADEELAILRQQNKGHFSAIFQKDSPFKAEENHFLPYMVEVADELSALLSVEDADYMGSLYSLMKKIHLLGNVLEQFHALADDEQLQSEQTPLPAMN